ncbi:hypothetical protein QFZ65_002927 [Arthrobacter sp. B3I9]|nr:hypothetical protein [Arthrobacter sp. B3I9]
MAETSAMMRNEPVPRADQPVIETDHAADEAGHHVVPVAVMAQLGQLPDARAERREQRDGHERGDDDRLEDTCRERGREDRAAKAPGQRNDRHGHGGAKVRPDAPVVRHGTCCGAEDRSHLVRGQCLHRADARYQQHDGQLDQSPAAHDGVHPARAEAGHDDQDEGAELDRLES